jgi:hypothetical protein
MRHARPGDLDRLEGFLTDLRAIPQLRERGRGSFSRGSRAFLHFHADDDGMYADVRLSETFERFRVTTRREQAAFVSLVRRTVRDS